MTTKTASNFVEEQLIIIGAKTPISFTQAHESKKV